MPVTTANSFITTANTFSTTETYYPPSIQVSIPNIKWDQGSWSGSTSSWPGGYSTWRQNPDGTWTVESSETAGTYHLGTSAINIEVDPVISLLLKHGFSGIMKVSDGEYTALRDTEKYKIFISEDRDTKLPVFKIEKDCPDKHKNRYEILTDEEKEPA